MFKISDKVVCVDDSHQKNKTIFIDGDYVVKGSVYDVRDVRMLPTGMVVYLTGLCCGYWWDGDEAGFKAIRFRKLEEIKEENRKKQEEPQPV